LEGKNVGDYKDPNGVPFFRDIVAVNQRDGQGFTAYSFPKLGRTEASPKFVYNVSYRPWDWILTTGIYVDDLDAAFRATLYQSLGILAVLAAALSAVVVLLNRGILRSLGGEPAVDITAIAGYYTFLAMQLNMARYQPEDGPRLSRFPN
jgi:methyl-accepting chemotaxis protein